MSRTKSNKTEQATVEPAILMRVEEGPYAVRIRVGPGINYPNLGGRLLGKGVHSIDKVQEGPGSKTGWGHLMDGGGWVGLDFVKKVSN